MVPSSEKGAGGWLRAAAAARLVGCSRHTLWRWAVAGIVPASATLKTGVQLRYAASWCNGMRRNEVKS